MKICSKCKIEKSFLDFYTSKVDRSGYQSRCKLCVKKEFKMHEEKQTEKCSVSGCENFRRARNGLCNIHAKRMKRCGTTNRSRQVPGLPMKHGNGYMVQTINGATNLQHIHIAEKALGKKLPSTANVHHVNGIRSDNRNTNLVICQDQKYHHLLHRRTRAYNACGNADWVKCTFCKKYDDKNNQVLLKRGNRSYHRDCARDNNYGAKQSNELTK